MQTIFISFITSLIVSCIVHYFFMTQIEKWFDAFFNEESKIFEKYAKEITEIIQKGKSCRNSDLER
jgi:hypothetical protein